LKAGTFADAALSDWGGARGVHRVNAQKKDAWDDAVLHY